MAKPATVVIDGVVYVPVTEATTDMQKIACGLLASFWGLVELDELDEKMADITVYVNDCGKGEPIEDVLRDIAEALSEPAPAEQEQGK